MTEPEYVPATRVVPDPVDGWSGADLTDDEYADPETIAAGSTRIYPPLMPADERIFTPGGAGA